MMHWIDLLPRQEFNKVKTLIGIVKVPVTMELRRIKSAYHNDESGFIRYQDVILGIERRWDALMKRRSEPKWIAWKVDVTADMTNN